MHRRSKVFCALCQRSEETKITGALSTKDEVTAHEHCLLFSSGICCESSPEVDDLFGFSVEDVLDEVERGDKLICHYCKKKGATAGCEVKRCKKSYHYPCAVQDGAKTIEDEQNGCYGLYCLKHYSQQQSNSTAGSPSVHSNDSSSSGRTIRTARKRPLSESEKQEESPSKRRTGDWNGMVSADPSDSAENETKPESDIILPLKSDLDESANSVPEDQFLHLSTVTQAIRQEESPSKYRIGDWNGMVSVDPSDSAENETKPESEIILPLKSDLDESANNVPEDQFLHLSTMTQAIRQEESPSKRRTGDWNGMVSADPSDSAENETKPESEIILPLKSDLDESANNVPEDQFLHLPTVTQAIRTDTEGATGSTAGNQQEEESRDENKDDDETDAESESLLLPVHVCFESLPLSELSCPPVSPPQAEECSSVQSPVQPTSGPSVPQQSSTAPPPSTLSSPRSSPCPSSSITPAPPETACVSILSSESGIDATSFWKSCNAAGCTQAIFTDFIHGMNEISSRILSDEASQEDYDLALSVMAVSGKLSELVAKQEEELQRKRIELQKAAAAMKDVVSALRK
ncbi:uncharacterized protein phf11 isoform X44 [Acanthochromis polyacanthus]|uniref:uncharacterized protein phf11 isoform X44 n=1 Tax=Acanthochromis polyacanthus TaxID=80966 RepID=UPI0022346852|nr:uncharacterized protein phf11 isoform X44 [Acanthochromis polyacanthus]